VSDSKLTAVLDALVPSRGDLPGAGELGLASAVVEDARDTGQLEILEGFLSRLPDDFDSSDVGKREQMLRSIESDNPGDFGSVVNMAYTAYYTDPRVLGDLSERTGYNPGPPQPDGYVLEAFDPQLLDPVRGRPPIWRQDH
jgi:hypothetical protein